VGWKYIKANEASQKYKEGKYILETGRVVVGVAWEEEEDDDDNGIETGREERRGRSGHVHTSSNSETAAKGSSWKGKGKGKGKEHTTTKPVEAESKHRSKPLGIRFLDETANIDDSKLRRRRWEHTPVFGMDEEEEEKDDDGDDDDDDGNEANDDGDDTDSDVDENGEVVFDSQDEDECEDLFAGIWNADVVRERRMSRRLG